MAKQFAALEELHVAFIEAQHIYFVGTAAPEGRVNLSPKGGDSLRVLSPSRILWRNLTGSGNETAGHLLQQNRMTLMWCSFTTRPLILRAYGQAHTIHADDPDFATLDAHFAPHVGARQIYDMQIDLVQTSCGWAVPVMEFQSEREVLDKWSETRGKEYIRAHWVEKNSQTIDGAPTR